MLDSKVRFSGTGNLYSRYRPSYPPELIDWIIETAQAKPGDRVADIGCGTGISTRLFAERGLDVVGIDPNEEMLTKAREIPGARYQKGESTATGLPSASIHLATAAQAFHWFEIATTMAELRRVLLPKGFCAAFWNVRARVPLMEEYEHLLNLVGDYREVPKPEATMLQIEAFPCITSLRRAEFPNGQILDREGFLGRVESSSYVAHGVKDRVKFQAALDDLFLRHEKNGYVDFRYRAMARMWQFE